MSEWEVWDSDEETVEDEAEAVEEGDEEIVEDVEEPIEDEEDVVTYADGEPAEMYVQGRIAEIPRVSDEARWLEWVKSYRQFKSLSEHAGKRGDSKRARYYERLARRYADLVFHNCPFRPAKCPIYDVYTAKCPVGMEKTCRPRVWRSARPRKVR